MDRAMIKNKLNRYSSGDGALHFVWMTAKQPHTATAKKVTKSDVERNLARSKNLLLADYRHYYLNGLHVLARHVERISETEVRFTGDDCASLNERTGSTYTLMIDKTCPCLTESNRHTFENTTISFCVKVGDTESVHELKNLSMKGAILFWLNHEKEIVEQDAARK